MLNWEKIQFIDCALCADELLPLVIADGLHRFAKPDLHRIRIDPEWGLCGRCVHRFYVWQTKDNARRLEKIPEQDQLNQWLAKELHEIATDKRKFGKPVFKRNGEYFFVPTCTPEMRVRRRQEDDEMFAKIEADIAAEEAAMKLSLPEWLEKIANERC